MPPDSRSIDEEGCLFSDFLLVRDGHLNETALREHMAAAGVRDPDERVADLIAQIACNTLGVRLLDELCDSHGDAVVAAWTGHVRDNAAEVMRDVIDGLTDGEFEDRLDDGSVIRVAVTFAEGRATIDFTGTSPQQPTNRNAPRAVTVAAVLYVFRTLARRPIPLNAGCLQPLDIVIPAGSLLDPEYPAAVVGGNVETSQRIVDVLYGALDKLAASQGTMNNVTFGDASFGYYETICGGAGAGFGFDGASAVHTHMTNTRITDPEVLEQRHPVIVREFSIRRGSGGRGVWNGGDGVVRRLQFTRPLTVSVLAERRTTVPFGLRADPGAPGSHEVTADGITIHTPGGGGYSPSLSEWAAMSPSDRARLRSEGRPSEPGDA
jgi:5-oxoprolinase (ATP-hydrolysing)